MKIVIMKRSMQAIAALAMAIVLLVSSGCQAPAKEPLPGDEPEPQANSLLQWSTFLGGSGTDTGKDIAVDKSGNIYIVGTSEAAWGTPLNHYGGGKSDAFVAKLDASGVLQWHAFLGGSSVDEGGDIMLDDSGYAYVVGTSYSSWGELLNPYSGGGSNVFVAKLAENGDLCWHTFSGSKFGEKGNSIAMDSQGNIYVTGVPGFAAKLDDHGAWQWHRSIGKEIGISIVTDKQANIYVAGTSLHGDLDVWSSNSLWRFNAKGDGKPIWDSGDEYLELGGVAVGNSGNLYVVGNRGALTPVFAVSLDPDGNEQWKTIIKAQKQREPYFSATGNIVVRNGNIFVIGSSSSTWGSPIDPISGRLDAFAAMLNSKGGLQWNTFLGGSGIDWGEGIALDDGGNIYVLGTSYSSWGGPLGPHNGGGDAFVAKLSGYKQD